MDCPRCEDEGVLGLKVAGGRGIKGWGVGVVSMGVSGKCQGHSSLDAPSELNPPQRIPSPLSTALLVPQAEG